MKKFLTLFLVVLLVSFSALTTFAAELDFMDNITIDVKLSPTTAKAGDQVTASFYLYNTDAPGTYNMSNGGDSNIPFTFDDSVLEFVSSSMGCGLKDSFLTVSGNTGTCFIEATQTYEIANTAPLFALTFKVKDVEANSYDVINVLNEGELVIANGDGVQVFGEITITEQSLKVEGGEDEGEDFEVTPGVTDGKTSISFFAKNPSGVELAAGNYGIYLGGQKFLGGLGSKIGGTDYPVGANGAWAITVVDDLGTVFTTDKAFNYSAFYIVDGVETIVPNSTAVWTVQ